MRYLRLLLLFAVVLVVAAGCGSSSSGPKSVPSGAVAIVGDEPIQRTDLDNLLAKTKRTYKAQGRAYPAVGTKENKSLQNAAVNYLVQQSEYEQGASDLGIKITDKQIEDRLTQAKQQAHLNQSQYLKLIKRQGLTDADVHENVRISLLQQAVASKVTKDAKISDSEIKKYYGQHKKDFATPDTRQVRHILFKPAQKSLADKIYKRLQKNPNSFAALVRKYSQDTGSKNSGGKVCVARGRSGPPPCIQTVPEFEKTSFELKTNAISKPVKTQFGWHIIQATAAVKPASTRSLDQVKDQIKQQLLPQKRDASLTKWLNDLKKKFKNKVGYGSGFSAPATTTASTAATTTG